MTAVGMVKGCIANALAIIPCVVIQGEEFKDHHKLLKGNNDILNLTQPHILQTEQPDNIIQINNCFG